MKTADMRFAVPRNHPKKDKNDEALRSPVSASVKNLVPNEVRKSEERLKRVRGPAMAKPGFEVKRRVEAVTAAK